MPEEDKSPSAEEPKNDAPSETSKPADQEKSDPAESVGGDKGIKGKFLALGKKKRAGVIAGVIFASLFLMYLVGTSSFFIWGVIVPQVGKILNADIEIGSISLSPFSSVEVTDVSVVTSDQLLSAGKVTAKYSLMSIIGGNINVSEVTVEAPSVTLIRKADGTTNLDPILEALDSGPKEEKESSIPQIDIGSVKVSGGEVSVTLETGEVTRVIELGEMTLDLNGLKNGATATGTYGGSFAFSETARGKTTLGVQSSVSESFDIALGPDLMPSAADLKGLIKITGVEGRAEPFAGTEFEMVGGFKDGGTVDLKFLSRQAGQSLGAVNVAGTLDHQTLDADLKLTVDKISAQALNIVGAIIGGMEFNQTEINSAYDIAVEGGKKITVKGSTKVSAFSLSSDALNTNPIEVEEDLDLTVNLDGAMGAEIRDLSVTVNKDSANALSFSTSGSVTDDFKALDLTLKATSQLAIALGILSEVPAGVDLKAGGLGFGAKVAGLVTAPSVDMTLEVKGLQGSASGAPLDGLETSVVLKTEGNGDRVDLKNATVDVQWDGQPAGQLTASGFVDLVKLVADLSFKIQGIDQRVLAPVLTPALGGRQLTSAKVEGNGRIAYDPSKPSAIQSEFNVRDIQLADVKGEPLGAPVELGAKADIALKGTQAEVKGVELSFTPTQRAQNKVTITGNAGKIGDNLKGDLKISSDGLDFTQLVDLFLTETGVKPAEEPETKEAEDAAPAPKQEEPDAIALPIERFVTLLDIDSLYLRSIEVKKIKANTTVEGSKVSVSDAGANVNGGDVNGEVELDLGVKGWKYALKAGANHVPVGAVADSFVPAFSNKVSAELVADVSVIGRGITGTSMKQYLTGHSITTVTNANIDIGGRVSKGIVGVISGLLNMPELTRSPVTYVNASVKLGEGMVSIQPLHIQSDAMRITSSGDIPIADNLMDSPLDLPIKVEVSENIAANLLTVKAVKGDYAPLPDFLKMEGTVGASKPNINKGALGVLAASGGVGSAVNAGKRVVGTAGDVGKAVTGVLNVFGGKKKEEEKKEATDGKDGEKMEEKTNEAVKAVEGVTKGLKGLKGLFGGGKEDDKE